MKTLGPVGAHLVNALYEQGRDIFTYSDINRILGKRPGANEAIIGRLVKQKIISRLKNGKYIIIPQEYGILEKYTGNKYVSAREAASSPDYYIAFYSAMEYWGMLTQPLLTTFVAVPVRRQPSKALKGGIKFVCVKKKNIWGITEETVGRQGTVRFSDREKTIIDALSRPAYSGGITEIARGMWLAGEKLNTIKLADYAEKFGKNVVCKRLGYLLEVLGMCGEDIKARLKKYASDRYDMLDPALGKKSLASNEWRLIDNVHPDRIKKAIWS